MIYSVNAGFVERERRDVYGGVICRIVGLQRFHAAPGLYLPGKAVQHIAVALHGRYVDGTLHAASYLYAWYDATIDAPVPFHEQNLLFPVYRLRNDNDFFSNEAVVLHTPFSGGHDVFYLFKVAESSVFQIIVGGSFKAGCNDARIGLQQIICRMVFIGNQCYCQLGQFMPEFKIYRFVFVSDVLCLSHQEVA